MNKIVWQWDNEPEWDPYTLLGSIKIENDHGESIFDNCTIIDSWIKPLLNGFILLKSNTPSEYDLIDEPDLLKFEIIDGNKYLSYAQQRIMIYEIDGYIAQLKQLCKDVLNYIQLKSDVVDKHAVDTLKSVIYDSGL